MSEKYKALNDNVLVRLDPEEQISKGGIVIAEAKSTRDRLVSGTVVAVGPGWTARNGDFIDMGFKEGDRVGFSRYSVSKTGVGKDVNPQLDENVVVVKGEDVFGVWGEDHG